ncbi:MAG: hypothetical protein K2M39_07990, partial [Muribaculaceae bacterium]|nr:hypothetical protein [Muribaculaceae bacterium]
QVLARLESASGESGEGTDVKRGASGKRMKGLGEARQGYQMSFFQLDDPLLSQIRDRLLGIDIDNLTPLQALTTLHDLKSLLTGK